MKLSFEIQKSKRNVIVSRKITDEMFKEICLLTPWVKDASRNSITERCYCIENNITEYPKCQECNNDVKYLRSKKYAEYCSKKCSANSDKTRNARKETTLKKYGVECNLQNEEQKKLITETNIKKYGCKYSLQNEDVRIKGKKTQDIKNNNNFGVKLFFTDDEFKELIKLTPHVKGTSRESTAQRKYCLRNNIIELPKCEICNNGVYFIRTHNNYSKTCSPECKEKLKMLNRSKTNIERYGHENPAHGEKAKEKIKETNLKKYDVDHNFKSPLVKELIKKTCIEKYGVEYSCQSAEAKLKSIETFLLKYGETHHMKNKEHLEDINFSEKVSIGKAKNFQARRNEQGTDSIGVVYILHFPHHKAVKIGLTSDFNQRSISLFKDFGEYNIIDIIETDICFKLESSLHQKFSKYRMCLDEGCGRTEFFHEEILNLL
jgi:endogenous inhibitor of DNA gyrase (YacG/DUF329 family)